MTALSRRALAALALVAASAVSALAQGASALEARPGWIVLPTKHGFSALAQRLDQAVEANKLNVVSVASASERAKAQGFAIPGNRVVGVFRNDFARRMLAASIPAGIEAPIRYYVVENADGTATLAYRAPSTMFAPYFAEAGADLKALAAELDPIFAKIAAEAVAP